jgi:hypothetical protein
LPYCGRYDPKDEITLQVGRRRSTKRYHIEFHNERNIDIFKVLLQAVVFTKLDIFELRIPFDIRAYGGEIILVVYEINLDLSFLDGTFEEYHKCNNVLFVMTVSDNLHLRGYEHIPFENRFVIFDELCTPQATFQ